MTPETYHSLISSYKKAEKALLYDEVMFPPNGWEMVEIQSAQDCFDKCKRIRDTLHLPYIQGNLDQVIYGLELFFYEIKQKLCDDSLDAITVREHILSILERVNVKKAMGHHFFDSLSETVGILEQIAGDQKDLEIQLKDREETITKSELRSKLEDGPLGEVRRCIAEIRDLLAIIPPQSAAQSYEQILDEFTKNVKALDVKIRAKKVQVSVAFKELGIQTSNWGKAEKRRREEKERKRREDEETYRTQQKEQLKVYVNAIKKRSNIAFGLGALSLCCSCFPCIGTSLALIAYSYSREAVKYLTSQCESSTILPLNPHSPQKLDGDDQPIEEPADHNSFQKSSLGTANFGRYFAIVSIIIHSFVMIMFTIFGFDGLSDADRRDEAPEVLGGLVVSFVLGIVVYLIFHRKYYKDRSTLNKSAPDILVR